MNKGDREQLEGYIAFLKKRLESENYKSRATPDEIIATKAKYDKAKSRLKAATQKK